MSASPQVPESPETQQGGESISESPERDSCGVTVEETESRKSLEKVVRTESDTSDSEVHSEAQIKQDNGEDCSGDISNGDAAREPTGSPQNSSGLKAEPEDCGTENIIQGLESIVKEKVPFDYDIVQNPPSDKGVTSSETNTNPVVIHYEYPKSFPKMGIEEGEAFQCWDLREYLGQRFGKPDETRVFVNCSSYWASLPEDESDCRELEAATRALEIEDLRIPGGFEAYDRHSSKGLAESEDDTESESEQSEAILADEIPTCSVEDSQHVKTELIGSLSNLISREQESALFEGNKVRALEVTADDFTAKRISPRITVEPNKTQITLDVSRFSKETISCDVVGNKIDVYARECVWNNYGSEMHEIHQIFKLPHRADEDVVAYIKNDLLFIDVYRFKSDRQAL